MEKKHTRGPWRVVDGPHGLTTDGGRAITGGDRKPFSGETAGQWRHVATAYAGDDDREANAKLIAASPDMAEALRETVGLLERLYRGEPIVGEVLDAIDSGRAALRKARVLR